MSDKKLRIVIGSLNIGGTETHLSLILPLLRQNGWQIKVITLQPTAAPHLISLLQAAGVNVETPTRSWQWLPRIVQRGMRLLNCVYRLWREFRTDRSTPTHFFLPEAYMVGMVAVKISRLTAMTIMSRRSLNKYQQKRALLRWFEWCCHRKVNFILGNSDQVMTELQELERVPTHKLCKIYNGIPIERYQTVNTDIRQSMRQALDIATDEIVFIKVANLIPYKGHKDLLQALHLIRHQLPSWRLVCVGEDNGILPQLKILAAKLNLTENIIWLGSRQDMPHLLAMADIGVLCSHEEGFSNAILEGMAAGLPMVVTDVGGNREAVIDQQTGFVVAAKNPQQLSQALLSLAQNKITAKAMGIAGQTRVCENFSLQRCVAEYEKFYNEKVLA